MHYRGKTLTVSVVLVLKDLTFLLQDTVTSLLLIETWTVAYLEVLLTQPSP